VHLDSRPLKRCSLEEAKSKPSQNIWLSYICTRSEREENKLDPSRNKGIFVGYCEVSKAFKIYIPGYHHIEINRDVTFDEDATLKKSRRCHLEEVYEEEPVAPRVAEPVREVITSPDEEILEDHDIIESQEPPQMMISHKRKPA
jgi:hypothetical protein